MSRPWRVGRSLGRTLYIQTHNEPSKNDTFVGVMDTTGLADMVVAAVNAREQAVELRSLHVEMEAYRADLYAQVKALPGSAGLAADWVLRTHVLALFNGGTDVG